MESEWGTLADLGINEEWLAKGLVRQADQKEKAEDEAVKLAKEKRERDEAKEEQALCSRHPWTWVWIRNKSKITGLLSLAFVLTVVFIPFFAVLIITASWPYVAALGVVACAWALASDHKRDVRRVAEIRRRLKDKADRRFGH